MPEACSVGQIYKIPTKDVGIITTALQSINWTRQPRPYIRGEGFCVGATQDLRGSKIGYWTTEEQRTATKVVNAALKRMKIPGFTWSSLQFNRNTVSEPHVDKNNVGLSAIFLLGKYVGGSLSVADGSFRSPPGKSGIAAIIDGCACTTPNPLRVSASRS